MNKTQLQRFLGSLNYIRNFYLEQAKDTSILYQRLKKNLAQWNKKMIEEVKCINPKIHMLCMGVMGFGIPKLSFLRGYTRLTVNK